MEIKSSTQRSEFNTKPFKIVYPILYAIILLVDAIIIISLFTIWAKLETVEYILFGQDNGTPRNPFGTFLYCIFLYSPIVKGGFDLYEVIRFCRFFKSKNQDKGSAINVARGFMGNRIYRIHYLVIIAFFTVMNEIFEYTYIMGTVSGGSAFLRFYWMFSIFLFFHILLLIVVPRILKFSIDYNDKNSRTNIILNLILWTIVLIAILNLNFFIWLFILILSNI